MAQQRTYRAGQSIEDHCRACKADRIHTVIVVDDRGQPIRVACGFCRSEHNYRGGPAAPNAGAAPIPGPRRTIGAEPFPLVSDRERIASTMTVTSTPAPGDLELLLRRIIREEAGITTVAPAEKWRGGTL